MKKLICLVAAVLCITLLCCGCEQSHTPLDSTLKIVAVSFPEYDFARAVAGDCAKITMLIPPAGEAHDYEPTVSDIKSVNDCDLFIYTGGESDTWVQELLNSVNNKSIATLKMTDCVDELFSVDDHSLEEHSHEDDKFTFDEHVWTSPENAISIVKAIESSLKRLDPESSQVFESNSTAYCQKLSQLDESIRKVTDGASHNTLVFGDRFPLTYFAKSYGLNYMAAFSGCSEDTEASASTVAGLIDYVKDNNIPVVFVNELSNTAIADRIAKETGSTVMTFYSCHKISKNDFESGKNYIDIMSRNLEPLSIALK